MIVALIGRIASAANAAIDDRHSTAIASDKHFTGSPPSENTAPGCWLSSVLAMFPRPAGNNP